MQRQQQHLLVAAQTHQRSPQQRRLGQVEGAVALLQAQGRQTRFALVGFERGQVECLQGQFGCRQNLLVQPLFILEEASAQAFMTL
ncbi:hypothetical protein D3C80_2070600 [compost metagenome]